MYGGLKDGLEGMEGKFEKFLIKRRLHYVTQ